MLAAATLQTQTINLPKLDLVRCQTSMSSLSHQYIEYLKGVENSAKSTINTRRSILSQFTNFHENPDIRDLTLSDIDDYLVARSAKVAASTVNQDKQALRSFFEFCQARRNVNPKFDYTMIRRSRERPPKVRTFTRQEIASVISQCSHELDALMIATLYETGVRIAELASLRVEDIRETEIQIRGKGSKDRVVMMTPALAAALRRHLVKRRISRGHVFQPVQHHWNHPNERFGTCRIRERIQREFQNIGIEMHPHQLRHSFALNWLVAGGDIRSLQKLLGHESIETTQRYLNLTDNHLGEEYRRHMVQSVVSFVRCPE